MSRTRLVVSLTAGMTAMSVVTSAQSRLFVFGGPNSAEVSLETGAISSVDTGDVFAPEVVDGDASWQHSFHEKLRRHSGATACVSGHRAPVKPSPQSTT